jgi:hypothetical protein
MKYKHPKKSLKDLTEIELKKAIPSRSPLKFKHKLRLQPHPPGCLSIFPGDSLAPIKLTINNQPELFLWHTENTQLSSEFNFALQLLSDLEVSLPKPQLLELAEKCALSIREQVQQYREVQGARHSYQGLTGEHLVPLQFSGQGFQWDLACKENSPEYFARVLCQDMQMPESGYSNIAFKLRNALKSHKMRLASCLNEASAAQSAISSTSDPSRPPRLATLDMLELESSIQELIPVIPFKRESK